MKGDSHRREKAVAETFRAPETLRRPIPSIDDLRMIGRRLQRQVPFESIAPWEAGADRRDPLDLIAATNEPRHQSLVRTRIKRMTESPYTFFRGSAEVMLADLESLPISGIYHPICGDAHLGNFGPYELSEDRTVFDLNDFDQAGLGPWEWDVARLCTSVVLAVRAGRRSSKDEQVIAAQTVRAYRRVLAGATKVFIVDRIDDAVFDTPASAEAIDLPLPALRKLLKKDPTVPGKSDRNVDKRHGHQPRFDDSKELKPVKGSQADAVYAALDDYLETLPPGRAELFAKYEAVDVARGQAGIGSLGEGDYRVLLRSSDDADLLEIQIKEASPSPRGHSLKLIDTDHVGRGVVLCQRSLQAFIDPLLGWTYYDGKPFYVRKRRATPGKFVPEAESIRHITYRGVLCGAALAYAHARCGNPELVTAYLGKSDRFDKAMARFASAYANQVESDYAQFHAVFAAKRNGHRAAQRAA